VCAAPPLFTAHLFTIEKEDAAFVPGSRVAFSMLPRWIGMSKCSIYLGKERISTNQYLIIIIPKKKRGGK
jgi:hypothetical protein